MIKKTSKWVNMAILGTLRYNSKSTFNSNLQVWPHPTSHFMGFMWRKLFWCWNCEAQELHFQSVKISTCKSRSLEKVNTKKAWTERFLNFLKFFFEKIHINIIPHPVLAGKNQIRKFAYIKASYWKVTFTCIHI